MKYLTILSTLAAVFVLGMMIYGFSLPEETQVQKSMVLGAPDVVVWNALSNFPDHHKWQKSIKALYNYNHSARQVRYVVGSKTIMANQQVRLRESAQAIDFIQIGHESYTTLQNIGGQISLKHLADGNTEILWKISYQNHSLTQKLLAHFFVQEHFEAILEQNLLAFKQHIEE